MMRTKTVQEEKLHKAYMIVAFAKLKHKNKPFGKLELDNETARIERCCDYYYLQDSNEKLHYFDYVKKFIQDNFKDMISSNKFDGNFIDFDYKHVKKHRYQKEHVVSFKNSNTFML